MTIALQKSFSPTHKPRREQARRGIFCSAATFQYTAAIGQHKATTTYKSFGAYSLGGRASLFRADL